MSARMVNRGAAAALATTLSTAVAAAGCGDGGETADRATPPPPTAIAGFIGGASGAAGGRFSEPSDVAVYSGRAGGVGDDKLFVTEADRGRNGRVQRLDGHGNFELAWGRDVVRDGKPGDTGTGPEVCRRAEWCKAAPPGTAAGAFRQPTGVAINDRTGHVYVTDTGNRRVQEFTGAGEFVRAWGWGVATGAAAFEVCRIACRAGRSGRAEGNGNAGQLAPVPIGGIAVRPGRGDVLVSDGGNGRVLQFTADGRFQRAWGLGVATGADRFESCLGSGCRSARAGAAGWSNDRGGWPRQLTIDAGGVVYAADARDNDRIIRFDLDRVSRPGDARAALLQPLPSGHPMGGADNMGLDFDSERRRLVVLWNPFGPMRIATVTDPGRRKVAGHKPWPEVALGYLGSTLGLATSPATGLTYVAKSDQLNLRDARGIFSSCPAPRGGEGICQGLAVLGPKGSPRAVLERSRNPSATSVELSGTVTVTGAARYVFQTRKDRGRWTSAGPARYVTATRAQPVRAVARRLASGRRYTARILLTWRDPQEHALQRATSQSLTFRTLR